MSRRDPGRARAVEKRGRAAGYPEMGDRPCQTKLCATMMAAVQNNFANWLYYFECGSIL